MRPWYIDDDGIADALTVVLSRIAPGNGPGSTVELLTGEGVEVPSFSRAKRGGLRPIITGGKGADLTHPKVSPLASPHRPEASDGAFDAPRRG